MRKKLLSLILALIMVLGLVPTVVMAEPITEGSEIAAEASAYTVASLEKAIVDAARSGESSLSVRSWQLSTDQMDEVILRIQLLYPELYFAYITDYWYDPTSNNQASRVFISYDENADTMKAEMSSALNRIYAELEDQNIQNMNGTEKALCIHDYLCANIFYTKNIVYDWCHTAYGPLVQGTGVCEGYAKAFMLLAQHYGLTCGIAYSRRINHAWNVIRLNGSWYHIDPTWDDPSPDMLGRVKHSYFLLTEGELLNMHSDRRDMVIRVLPGDTYSKNASGLTGFWKNTSCRCYYDGNKWNYLDKSNHLVSTDLSGSNQTVLTSGTYRWSGGGSSYWSGCYGQMFGVDGNIYYSTSNQIRQYQIANGTDIVYAAPQLPSGELIYGMGLQKGQIVYALETSPNFSHEQTYLSLALPACTTHCYRAETVSATCTADGYTVYTCNRCGYSYKGNHTKALGHAWDTGRVTKEATEDHAGIRTYTCSRCKKTKTETIPQLLATPVLTSAKLTATGVTVKWNAVSGAENYRVFYKASGAKSWTKVGDTKGTSLTVTGLTSGTTYTFTVRCVSADGKTYTSNYNATGKTVTYVAAPVIKTMTPTTTGMTLKWNASAGAGKYRVFYKEEGAAKFTKFGDTTGTSATVTGLKSGTGYIFTVQCLNASGKVYVSSYVASSPVTYLSAPTVTAAKVSATGVTVTWKAVPGAENYRVYYKASGTKSWTNGGDTTGTGKAITGLTSGTSYTFVVRCINAEGTAYTSAYNTTGKTVTYVAAPVIKTMTPTTTGMTLKWNASTGAGKYRVFYKEEGAAKFTKFGDTTGTSMTVTGLKSGTGYVFTVQCLNASGKAYVSSYVTSKPITYLSAPTLTSVKNTADGVTVTWKAVAGAENYRVFCKANGDKSWTKVGDTTDTGMIATDLTSGKTYTFVVRCVNAAGTAYTSAYNTAGKTITRS